MFFIFNEPGSGMEIKERIKQDSSIDKITAQNICFYKYTSRKIMTY